jgi:hypothetical protein
VFMVITDLYKEVRMQGLPQRHFIQVCVRIRDKGAGLLRICQAAV